MLKFALHRRTSMPQEYRLILKYADEPGYTPDLECYLRHGGYEAAAERRWRCRPKDLPDGKKLSGPEQIRDEVMPVGPARAGRGGFFLRPEVVVRGPQERQADLPDLQRGRIRAGHVQGSADHPQGPAPVARGDDHLLLRQRRASGLHLHPRRDRRGREAAEPGAGGSPREEFPGQEYPGQRLRPGNPRASRRRGLYLRRGNRADRIARRQARLSAHQAAVFPGGAGPVPCARRSSTTSRRCAP